jgi:hypothetical protein
MKILESYKKIAKSMLTEHAWDRKFGEPLPTLEDVMKEAESMKLQPKGGGKTVVFKNKDNYEKAKKSGDYEEPEETDDGGEKEDPSGKLGSGDFDRGSADSDSETGKDYVSKFQGTDEPDDDKPDSSVARKKLDKMSRKELAKTDYPFDDDDNYLGSDDYDPEDDAHSAPDLDGLEDVDRTTLKQKYMDLEAHKQKMEYDMDDAESQDDSDWEEESRDNYKAAVKNQNKILQLLKPQMPTTDMGGRSTRGGPGIRDSIKINGKKYKEVKEHAWDRKFGEPLPTLTDVMKVKEDKKVTEKHILRENYERFGGK